MVATLSLIGGVLTLLASNVDAVPLESRAATNVLPSYISTNLGPYSPYLAQGSYPAVPAGCTLNQVNILQRHGQRFPTASAGKKIKASVAKFAKATSLSADLAFAKTYTFTLGADSLTPNGAAELHTAGQNDFIRYQTLYAGGIYTRTDNSQRVVDSAGNWTQGFYLRKRVQYPPAALIIDGTSGSNATLENNCDDAPDLSSYETAWLNIFAAPATARLNAAAPGANLTTADTLNFMQLCGFDTEYSGTLSSFCPLFTQSEWAQFEYYYDLDKYYGTGYGQPLGAIQGVGYVNELMSRLTNNRRYAAADQTQVNHTLDNSATTFPLDRSIYADFSHDNQITAILAALGLKKDAAPLSSSGPSTSQVWKTSQIVPFGGKVVSERLLCGGVEHVRILINDQLQIPTACANHDATTGLCTVANFIESQAYARNSGYGDFFKCGWTPL